MVKSAGYTKPFLLPEERIKREKNFILDCVAIGTLSSDKESFNSKYATGIPPYNSQKDKTVKRYFKQPSVQRTLRMTKQDDGGDSINGKQADYFHTKGSMGKYLETRNKNGAGCSAVEVAGHELFMSNPRPVFGYNGEGGYRRNTPALRYRPSVFDSNKI